MGKRVKCPDCGNEFFVHGFEDLAKCYSCNSTFNPQRNFVEGEI